MNDAFLTTVQEPESPAHACLLAKAKKLVEMSRKDMGKNYDKWDYLDSVFRSERPIDKEDEAARKKKQPAKMVVPNVKAQVMTFVAFACMTLQQNKRFFELEPTGVEDDCMTETFELILERDCRRNAWTQFLVQFFLDIGRFSLGCAEICYEESFRFMRVPETETEEQPFVGDVESQTFEYMKIPTFQGNRVHSVSPYRFFPDTRLPLTRYQEGEFCASEDIWSMASLKAQPGLDLFSTDKIKKLSVKDRDLRKGNTRADFSDFEVRTNPNMKSEASSEDKGAFVKDGSVMITKVVMDLIPKDVKDSDGKKLGDEDFPVRMILWYANDNTIIRFGEAYYLHCQFPYVCAQFMADQHKTVNESLADDCEQITSLITWLINAHVTSVRSTIDSKFIVDPSGIDMASLESRSPYIMLKKNMAQLGIDRYIKQFQVQDVTGGFMQDAAQLTELLERLTGLSGNMMGQYNGGRRTATEARVVTQGASARAKTSLAAIWDSAFEPLARQFLANNRQEMEQDTFMRIVGKGPFANSPDSGMPMELMELFARFKADPMEIATGESFFTFDGTSPSEKSFLAQSLQEILLTMMQNPQIMQIMGYGPNDIRQLLEEIYILRGVTQSRLPAPKAMPQPGVVPMPPQALPAPTSAVSNG